MWLLTKKNIDLVQVGVNNKISHFDVVLSTCVE